MRPSSRILDRLLRLVILTAAALVPVVFYLKSYEVFNDTKSWTLRAFGMLTGVLLLARGEPVRTKGLPGAVALLGACILSMQHTPLIQASLERISEFLSFAILMIAAETSGVGIRRLLACALWAFSLVMVYATGQYFDYDVIGWTKFEPGGRVYSTMGNPDFLGAHTSILAPVMIGLLGASIVALRRPRSAAPGRPASNRVELLGPAILQALRTILIFLGHGCGIAAIAVALFALFHPFAYPEEDFSGKNFALRLLGVAGLAAFAAGLIFRVKLRDVRNLLILLLVVVMPSFIYTGARGALLGFLVCLPVGMLLAAKTVWGAELSWWQFALRTWRWFVGVYALLGLIIWTLPTGRHMIDRVMEFTDPLNSTMQIRMFYWYSGWLMGRGEPTAPGRTGVHVPTGAGIGAFHLAGQRTQGRAQEIWNIRWPRAANVVSPHLELYAHNDYVHLFAEIGPIGLGIYLWIMAALLLGGIAGLWRLPENSPDRWILIGLISATVSWYANSMSNFPLKVVQNAHVFWCVVVPALLHYAPFPVRVVPVRVPGVLVVVLGVLVSWRIAAGGVRTMASHYLKFGHAMTQQGGPEAALGLFSRAGRIDSVHTDGILIHYYRGKAYQAAGKLDEAEAAFTRALDIFVNFPEGYQGRAMVRYSRAIELLTGAPTSPATLGAPPTDTTAAKLKASQDAAGFLERAAEDLEASRFLNPKDAVTWLYTGFTKRLRGDHQGAISAFRNAITYSSINEPGKAPVERMPEAYYYIALAHLEGNRLPEARAAMEEGFSKFPPNAYTPEAHALRARLARLPGARAPKRPPTSPR